MDKAEPGFERATAFMELFDAFYDKVLAYAVRRLGPHAASERAAEQAAAGVFATAWIELDEAPTDPLPWLYAVARGAIADLRDAPGDAVWGDTVIAALFQLTDPEREVLSLMAWEELSASTAAAVVGWPPLGRSVRVHRARRRLLRLMSAESPGTPRRVAPVLGELALRNPVDPSADRAGAQSAAATELLQIIFGVDGEGMARQGSCASAPLWHRRRRARGSPSVRHRSLHALTAETWIRRTQRHVAS